MLGVGMALTMAAAAAAIMGSVASARAGVASDVSNTSRQVRAAFGVAVLASGAGGGPWWPVASISPVSTWRRCRARSSRPMPAPVGPVSDDGRQVPEVTAAAA